MYDDQGTPLTATFVDYAMPTAADTITLEASNTETPTPVNPLGAKGIGESATIGSTPAVQNAVVDALRHLGVRHIDLPCTPERVWRAINGQGRRCGGSRRPSSTRSRRPTRSPRTSRPERRLDLAAERRSAPPGKAEGDCSDLLRATTTQPGVMRAPRSRPSVGRLRLLDFGCPHPRLLLSRCAAW